MNMREENQVSNWKTVANFPAKGGIALAMSKHHRVVLKVAIVLGVVLSGIALPQTASANLFAVTDNDEVAEQLSYGPGALTTSSSAFLSTDSKDIVHHSWFQEVALDGTNVDFTVLWQFSSAKTLAQRFADAYAVGESVTWTIIDGATTQVISGTWRFSNGAGITTARLNTSGTRFSDDDGIWGAGTLVDGNNSSSCSSGSGVSWGVGNCNGSDLYHSLWRNGARTTVPATLKNFMYITDWDCDGDGVLFPDDNCACVANPGQEDADADGVGDVCDICPDIANPEQDNTAACIALKEPESNCIPAAIDLLGEELVAGEVTVEQVVSGSGTFTKPDGAGVSVFDEITPDLRIARDCCEGVFNLGTDVIQWAAGTCAAPTSGFFSSHSSMISSLFRPVDVNLPGSDTCLRDVSTSVDYDILWGSWSCCGSGGFAYSRDGLPVQTPVVTVPYTHSELPEKIDISALADGPYELCVSATPEPPPSIDAITFEILNTLCGEAGTYEFFLNGVSLGTASADPSGSCDCDPPLQTFTVTDSGLLENWNPSGPNTVGFTLNGTPYLSWVRVVAEAGTESSTACIFDQLESANGVPTPGGGDCSDLDLCSAGYTYDYPGFITAETDKLGEFGGEEKKDCSPFSMADEDWIAINSSCNQPPRCEFAVADPDELWPVNHKFADVSVVGVTDPDGDPVTITITSVLQDEPVEGLGDGNTCPDAWGVGTSIASVRAERSGTKKAPGDGREYSVEFRAEDDQGGECDGQVTVCVPHDKGQGNTCVDGGPFYDSTMCGEQTPIWMASGEVLRCGSGFELAFLVPPLLWLRQRRRSCSA